MTEEKSKKLIRRFKFFHPEKDLRESLMAFGFECDDGWFNILWDLCEKIEQELNKLSEEAREDFEVIQVKEKFGSLRFYPAWETDEISALIEEAEKQSEKTCEICGAEGEVMTSGYWLKALCSGCAKERNFKRFDELEKPW